MKKFILGSLSAVLVLAIVMVIAFSYFRLGFAPVRADVRPGVVESALMSSIVHSSVRHRAAKLQNPQAPSDDVLIEGAKIYLNDCAGCHGEIGKVSDFGASFYPPAPQFTQNETQYSEAEIFWVARHGIRRTGMTPQYGHPDEKLWLLAAFIKHASHLAPGVLQGIQQRDSK